MKKRVVITGLGVFCSIGKNVKEVLQSLREGRTGIGPITLFDTSKYPSKIGAHIRDYRPEEFFEKKELKRLSRIDQFVLIASEEAVKNSRIHLQSLTFSLDQDRMASLGDDWKIFFSYCKLVIGNLAEEN